MIQLQDITLLKGLWLTGKVYAESKFNGLFTVQTT